MLALLALAGLLRPEAWLFSAAYVLWLLWPGLRGARAAGGSSAPARAAAWRDAVPLVAIAASGPLLWALHDLLLTGNALHSLTGTRDNAALLGRVTGIEHVPQTAPRRLGEILREPVLLAAAGGGLLALAWRRDRRVRLGVAAGVLTLAAFCVLAAAGLPIITRYLLLTATLLAIFAGAGAFGWLDLLPGRERTWWARFGLVALLALLAFVPSQAERIDRLGDALTAQEAIQGELGDLVAGAPLARPIAVANRRPIPLLALWLKTEPSTIVDAQNGLPPRGSYLVPATEQVARDYILDRRDRDRRIPLPHPGFVLREANASWRLFDRRIVGIGGPQPRARRDSRIGRAAPIITLFVPSLRLIVVVLATLLVPAQAAAAPQSRIVGGVPATQPWPAQTSVRHSDGGTTSCGGTLVSARWVLTAAHCVMNDAGNVVAPGTFALRIGSTSRDDGGFTDHRRCGRASRRVLQSAQRRARHDLALLHLTGFAPQEPMRLIGSDARDAPLWSPGTTATIIGWGRTSTNGPQSATLLLEGRRCRSSAMRPAPRPACGERASALRRWSAPAAAGADTCNGDSGGPLIVPRARRVHARRGTSRGATRMRAQPGFPGVYARLGDPAINAWVRSTVPTVSFSDLARRTGRRPAGHAHRGDVRRRRPDDLLGHQRRRRLRCGGPERDVAVPGRRVLCSSACKADFPDVATAPRSRATSSPSPIRHHPRRRLRRPRRHRRRHRRHHRRPRR